MKKRTVLAIGLIVCMMFAAFGFSACNKHEHTFETEWTRTETHHYHAATCEHMNEKQDEGTHEYDDDNDTTCNVCGYERVVEPPHEHTFEKEWTRTETHHYHAANCVHTNEKQDEGLHEYDDDNDTTCNVCGYERVVEPPHEHTFEKEWTRTETHHYHAANCVHTNEKQDEGLHDTAGANGTCSVCGYYSVFMITASSQSGQITATIEAGKSLQIDFTGMEAGYYVFTNTGDDPIIVSWSCGEDSGSKEVIQSGEDFTVKISDMENKAVILITSESKTEFTVTLSQRYSEENPDGGWSDFH